MTTYMTEADVLEVHNALVAMFKNDDPIEPSGPRDDGTLLASAVSRPTTSLGGIDKYESVLEKSAALFHSLAKNHPFHNGNKRTALVATLVFLDRNGYRLDTSVTDDEVFTFVTTVAADQFPDSQKRSSDAIVEEITSWLRNRSSRRTATLTNMGIDDFLKKAEQVGGRFREAGTAWLVQGTNGDSVRIGRDTRRLDGNVVRKYVTKLGLAGPTVGVYVEEFQDGIPAEHAVLVRFRNVLKRLADT